MWPRETQSVRSRPGPSRNWGTVSSPSKIRTLGQPVGTLGSENATASLLQAASPRRQAKPRARETGARRTRPIEPPSFLMIGPILGSGLLFRSGETTPAARIDDTGL